MCNIGLRPTVSHDTRLTIETNIFDFDEDIYGLPIKVTFLHKIRDEHRFSSIGELKAQLEQDRNSCM
jgi:riboflavin kinase/FMN adenylyltransferase